MIQKRVVVAMSGGVDSSVAALMLARQGYEVIGVSLRLFSDERPNAAPLNRGCCSAEDIEDARRVCQLIGARHYVVNAEREFREFVINYFLREYQSGRTPHPCIACNDRIKFDFLLERALALEASLVATGHYARIQQEADGTFHLLRAIDKNKDQSYVLFGLSQEQLGRLSFPVGNLTKLEIRQLALEADLPVAGKPDSQEICFIPMGDYRAFLKKEQTLVPGKIVNLAGQVLGDHPGIGFFTIGQRRGLGITSDHPLYVIDLEPKTHRVIVGTEEALYATGLRASKVNWIDGLPVDNPIDVLVKTRYKSIDIPATLIPNGSSVEIRFQTPQRAVTPGQAVVFYQGDRLLGGAFIDQATRVENVLTLS
jgi:tRNA-specific 2-thiouridylase